MARATNPAPVDPNVNNAGPAAPAVESPFSIVPESAPPAAERPNHFTPHVADLIAGGHVGTDQGFGFDIPEGFKLATVKNQLQRAGAAATSAEYPRGVSLITKVTQNDDGTQHVYVRATPKRKSKKGDDTAE